MAERFQTKFPSLLVRNQALHPGVPHGVYGKAAITCHCPGDAFNRKLASEPGQDSNPGTLEAGIGAGPGLKPRHPGLWHLNQQLSCPAQRLAHSVPFHRSHPSSSCSMYQVPGVPSQAPMDHGLNPCLSPLGVQSPDREREKPCHLFFRNLG